jgi:hypothetical protein
MDNPILWLILWVVQGLVGYLLGKSKGRQVAGFWWSFWLGIIGWIITCCLKPAEPRREVKYL